MKKLSVNELLDVAAPPDPSSSRSGSCNSKYSFGIVNSPVNGKRITVSKGLAGVLGLKETVDIALVPEQGCVLVSKNLPGNKVMRGKLSPKSVKRRICYNSGMVREITRVFGLNFSVHVSVSYDDITLGNLDDGTPVAIVNIYNKYPVTTTSTVTPDAD